MRYVYKLASTRSSLLYKIKVVLSLNNSIPAEIELKDL